MADKNEKDHANKLLAEMNQEQVSPATSILFLAEVKAPMASGYELFPGLHFEYASRMN